MSFPSHPGSSSVRPPPQTLRLSAGACTDVGAVRTENQDAFGVLPELAIPAEPGAGPVVPQPAVFAVADGMGGHEAGAEASTSAVEAMMGAFGPAFRTQSDRIALMSHAVTIANDAVWARANAGTYRRQMGTTCTLLLVADGQAYLGHVGDSRAYRIRDGEIEQLTTDHTMGEAARRDPSLAEIARTRSHHLTRAVGIRADVEVDAFSAGAVRPDDRYVLCSDGLAPVELAEIVRAVHAYAPQEASDWLVALASQLGSRDNATAVVVHVVP